MSLDLHSVHPDIKSPAFTSLAGSTFKKVGAKHTQLWESAPCDVTDGADTLMTWDTPSQLFVLTFLSPGASSCDY